MRSALTLTLPALVCAAALIGLSARGASAQAATGVEADCATVGPLLFSDPFGPPSSPFAQASCQVIEQGAPISAPATIFAVSASPYGASPSECDGVTAPDYATEPYSGPLPALSPDLAAWLAAPDGCAFTLLAGTVYPGEPLGTELFDAGAAPPDGPTELNALICGDPSCGAFAAAVYAPSPLPFGPTLQIYQPPSLAAVIAYPGAYSSVPGWPQPTLSTFCTDGDADCDTDPAGGRHRDHRWQGHDPSGDGDRRWTGDANDRGSGDGDQHWTSGAGSQPSNSSTASTTRNTASTSAAPTWPPSRSNASATDWTWTANRQGSGDSGQRASESATAGADHHGGAGADHDPPAATTPARAGGGAGGSAGQPGHGGRHGH